MRKKREVSPAPGTEHLSLDLIHSRVHGVVGIDASGHAAGKQGEGKTVTHYGGTFFSWGTNCEEKEKDGVMYREEKVLLCVCVCVTQQR